MTFIRGRTAGTAIRPLPIFDAENTGKFILPRGAEVRKVTVIAREGILTFSHIPSLAIIKSPRFSAPQREINL